MGRRAVWSLGLIVGGVAVTALGVGLWMTGNGKTDPASGGDNAAQSRGATESTTRPPQTTGTGSVPTIERYDEALRARLAQTQDKRQTSSAALEASVGRLGRLKPGAETDEAVAALAPQGDAAVAEIGRQLTEEAPGFGWQHNAVRVLKAVNTDKSRAILRRMALAEMGESPTNIEAWAAQALITCDPAEAWTLLASDAPEVPVTALNALEGQPVDEKRMALLKTCFDNKDAFVGCRAAGVMAAGCTGKLAKEAVEAIAEGLTAVADLPNMNDPLQGWSFTEGERYYHYYLNALAAVRVDNQVLHRLAKRLQGRARDTVLLALARGGDKSVHDELVNIAQNPKAGIFRAWAATSLGEIGTLDDLPLLRTLAETDPLVRDGHSSFRAKGPNYPVRRVAESAIRSIERREREGARK